MTPSPGGAPGRAGAGVVEHATVAVGTGRAAASPDRRRRMRAPVVLAGTLLLASMALHVRDPHQHASWGLCPWLVLTGTYCPGCGGLRAVNDLTRLDLRGAASSNLLFVVSVPLLGAWWSTSVVQRWRGPVHRVWSARTINTLAVGLLAVALVFGVVRNLPAGAWLAP